MALDYTDSTLSRPEKVHHSYYRAQQKIKPISQKTQTKPNNPQKSNKKPQLYHSQSKFPAEPE